MNNDATGEKELIFTVDTHLFRELGSLLVARDSTALAELIKNAYDADASFVRVYAEGLRSGTGFIKIEDDGVGITEDEFRRGFLRIASRLKELGARRSRVYERRFTGAKGIGRLAAHKLAALLELDSTANRRNASVRPIRAAIDWDMIEEKQTLDQATGAVTLRSGKVETNQGTIIRLSRLRRRWSEADVKRFITEASSLRPPKFLAEPLPKELLSEPLLFSSPIIRDSKNARDPGFDVELLGDFASGDEYWPVLAAEIEWILEIRARRYGVSLMIAPSRAYKLKYPDAASAAYTRPHPSAGSGPYFDARILMRNLLSGRRTLTDDDFRRAGVRAFMEGFRVLPYGEPKNDWLDIGKEYSQRTREMLFETLSDEDPDSTDEIGLTRIAPRALYGAIFLTEQRSHGLDMLVNREGFDETRALEGLRKIVRWGIHTLMRVRAAATDTVRQEKKGSRSSNTASQSPGRASERPAETGFISARMARNTATETLSLIRDSRDRVSSGSVPLPLEFQRLQEQVTAVLDPFILRLQQDLETLRVLAGVGLQLSVFVHEINALLNIVSQIEHEIAALPQPGPMMQRRAFSRLKKDVDDLRRNLERQASYLTDMAAPDIRRRRTPQRLLPAVDRALDLLRSRVEEDNITVAINVSPAELRTPKMFPSELRTVLTNLLTNAIKASLTRVRDRRIRIRAFQKNADVVIRVENTGAIVNVGDSENLFRPFVSTSIDPDPVLGQGMGLGLPITRAIVEQVNGVIQFVQPASGFATAVELRLREGR